MNIKTMLSERYQTQRLQTYASIYIKYLEKANDRDKKQISNCLGLRVGMGIGCKQA